MVLNGSTPAADPLAESTNRAELARWLDGVAVLAELRHGEDPAGSMDDLDWYERAAVGRR